MARLPNPTLPDELALRIRKELATRMKKLRKHRLKRADLCEDFDGLPPMSERTLDSARSPKQPLQTEKAVELLLRLRKAAASKKLSAVVSSRIVRDLHAHISRPALIVFPGESAHIARTIAELIFENRPRGRPTIIKSLTEFFSSYEEICKTYVGGDLMSRILSYFGPDWRIIVGGRARPDANRPGILTTDSPWKQFETWIRKRDEQRNKSIVRGSRRALSNKRSSKGGS